MSPATSSRQVASKSRPGQVTSQNGWYMITQDASFRITYLRDVEIGLGLPLEDIKVAREYVTNFVNNTRNPHIQATIEENFADDSETMAGPTQNRVKNPQNPVAQLERAARTKRGRSESDDDDDVEEGRRRIDDASFSPEKKVAHRRSVQSKENDGSAFTGGSTPKSAKRARTGAHSKAPAPKPSSGRRKAIPVEDAESDDDEATAPSAKKTAKDGEYVPSDTEEEDVPTALLEDPAMTDANFFGTASILPLKKLFQEERRLVLHEREVALREKELDLRERENVLRANEIQGGGN
ncbi:hypothetical protein B0H14DRAFT_3444320 [Mycena olivaceomarginata]|nr:hypothetical protein B0H14DRAFT_3444320 [Mycena olivaceomarginata]